MCGIWNWGAAHTPPPAACTACGLSAPPLCSRPPHPRCLYPPARTLHPALRVPPPLHPRLLAPPPPPAAPPRCSHLPLNPTLLAPPHAPPCCSRPPCTLRSVRPPPHPRCLPPPPLRTLHPRTARAPPAPQRCSRPPPPPSPAPYAATPQVNFAAQSSEPEHDVCRACLELPHQPGYRMCGRPNSPG